MCTRIKLTSLLSVALVSLFVMIGCTNGQNQNGCNENDSIRSCSDEGPHEYVDLGLPSGTLWATCNIGANSPEECGEYFAFGEVSSKDEYTWQSYNGNLITKYFESGVDCYELKEEDDAAFVKWGKDWRIPTEEQIAELGASANCTWTWVEDNNKTGWLVTSKYNSNSIFLPAAGYRSYAGWEFKDAHVSETDSTLYNVGVDCYYWSRTIDDPLTYPCHADVMLIGKEDACEVEDEIYVGDEMLHGIYRSEGCTIRPVYQSTSKTK